METLHSVFDQGPTTTTIEVIPLDEASAIIASGNPDGIMQLLKREADRRRQLGII